MNKEWVYLYNHFKDGETIVCVSDYGSPNPVSQRAATVGQTYKVLKVYKDYMSIIGNGGVIFNTDGDSFMKYHEYLSEKRENKINTILDE